MPRVVSLCLPFFPTDRIRRRSCLALSGPPADGAPPDEPPTVTAIKAGSRRLVASVNATARAVGLRPGQAVAQAQASVPGLVVADAACEADRGALDRLAGWCLRYSPAVQADPPDGLLLDVEGASHLLGGEEALLADAERRLGRAGYTARAAVADTPGAAWAMARYGERRLSGPGEAAAALLPLPVASLRLPPETCRALGLLGIDTVGQLAAFPRAQLTRRFGPDLLGRCDRAFGRADDPLTPLRPRDAARATLAFAEPLSHMEGLAMAVGEGARRLCRLLADRQQGARLLDTVFRRVDGCPIGIRIGTAAPSRDPAHLAALVVARLGEIDPGFGIDAVTLTASRAEALGERQTVAHAALAGEAPATSDALGTLVDRLSVRLGAARVFRAAPVESRVPERSVRRVPALAPVAGASWPPDLPRPPRLIDPPELVAATALLPDNPPSFFVWRRVRHTVRSADGPERVRGEWWRTDAEAASFRDYYRVEDDAGRRFWLFRDAEPGPETRWWLHGRFS